MSTVTQPQAGVSHGFRIVPSANGKIRTLEDLLQTDAYSVASAFVRGAFSIEGDIIAAIEFYTEHSHPRLRDQWYSILAALIRIWAGMGMSSKRKRVAHDIQFHYDRSNDFYRRFLGPSMLYSCAHFESPEGSLEEAQT